MSGEVQKVDMAIIGAGWYGLVAARTYLRLRPSGNVIIVDSDKTVGGVWSEDRLYPNLVAQVKLGLFNYTDTPMPKSAQSNLGLVTGKGIHDYLQKYAEDHDLLRRIRFATFVEKMERFTGGWRLLLRGTLDTIEAAKVMVATGVTSIPYTPELDVKQATFPVIHSMDLGKSYQMLADKSIQRVVVVGAAKSAYDCVWLLLSMGKEVTWVIRSDGAGPLAILPTKILGLLNSIEVASTRLMTHLSPSILNSSGRLNALFQRSKVGRWCVGMFWDTITYFSNHHAGYADGDHVAALKPEVDGKSVFWANSGLGVVTIPGFWSTIHNGKVQILRDSVQAIKADDVVFTSGTSMQADYLVLATGWGDHFAMFDKQTKLELGLPLSKPDVAAESYKFERDWEHVDMLAEKTVNRKLPFIAQPPRLKQTNAIDVNTMRKWRLYRRSIPLELALRDDRSLAIMGQIHTVQTPLVAEMQTFWTLLYLLRDIDLPDKDTMMKEIAEWNAWTRKRYLSQGLKFPYSLYDFLPYVDTICRDLGIRSHRKSNPISELFSPYKPEDFEGFIDEYLSKRGGRSDSGEEIPKA